MTSKSPEKHNPCVHLILVLTDIGMCMFEGQLVVQNQTAVSVC